MNLPRSLKVLKLDGATRSPWSFVARSDMPLLAMVMSNLVIFKKGQLVRKRLSMQSCTVAHICIACERRRISGCHLVPPKIIILRLRSQGTNNNFSA